MEKPCSCCGEPAAPGRKGWCGKCYKRWYRNGDPAIVHIIRDHPPTCSICDEPYKALGYCGKHLRRFRKHGDSNTVLPPSKPPIIRKYTLDEEYFAEISTPEQAYWLGFLAADGNISTPEGNGHGLSVELAEYDTGHLLKLAHALGSDAPVAGPRQACMRIRFNSFRLAETLVVWGLTERKSLVVEPPLERLRGLEPYYWRGLWDGDGTIHKKKRDRGGWDIGIVGSLACVDAFADWAREISGSRARPGNTTSKNPDCWQWHLGGTRMPQLLARKLRSAGVGFGLDRKQALLGELCAVDFDEHEAQIRARRGPQVRAAHVAWLASKRGAVDDNPPASRAGPIY